MGAAASTTLPTSTTQTKLTWISRIPCFATLSPSNLSILSSKIDVLTFKKGDYLVTEGHVGSLFGILVRGTVQISAIGPNGTSIVICEQGPGFYFGESSIIGNTPTTASIKAVDDSVTIYSFTRTIISELSLKQPEVRESLTKTISYRLKQNLLTIPFFAQLRSSLESNKIFKILGAFDLLATLFEVETFPVKAEIFKAGSSATKFYVICEGCVRISIDDNNGNDIMLNMLKKNDVFGEIALLSNTYRTATAKAFEPTLLLSITKDKFEKLFKVFPGFWDVIEPVLCRRTANSLKKVACFKRLSLAKKELIGGMLEFRNYEPDGVVCEEGSVKSELLILVSGTINVTTINATTKQIVKLGKMEEGSVMGEISLLTGGPRTATLIAETRCMCLVLNEDQFHKFLPLAPEIIEDLVETARARRANTIRVNPKACLSIPDVDFDVGNKLYIYYMLTSSGSGSGSGSGNKRSGSGSGSGIDSDVDKKRKSDGEGRINQLVVKNIQKRKQIDELKAQLLNLLKTSSKIDPEHSHSNLRLHLPAQVSKGRRNSWQSTTTPQRATDDITKLWGDIDANSTNTNSILTDLNINSNNYTSHINNSIHHRENTIYRNVNRSSSNINDETGSASSSFQTYSSFTLNEPGNDTDNDNGENENRNINDTRRSVSSASNIDINVSMNFATHLSSSPDRFNSGFSNGNGGGGGNGGEKAMTPNREMARLLMKNKAPSFMAAQEAQIKEIRRTSKDLRRSSNTGGGLRSRTGSGSKNEEGEDFRRRSFGGVSGGGSGDFGGRAGLVYKENENGGGGSGNGEVYKVKQGQGQPQMQMQMQTQRKSTGGRRDLNS